MMFVKIRERLESEKRAGTGLRNVMRNNVLDDCLLLIEELEAEYNNGWIKCEDELPKETQKYYLTYYKRDGGLLGTQNLAFVSKDYFMSDKRWEVEDEYPDAKVYYWQPLPQPPKGE